MDSIVRYAVDNGGNDIRISYPERLLEGCYSSGNPTCIFFDGKLIYNSRLVNYKKILQSEYSDFVSTGMNQTYFLNGRGFNSRNCYCFFDCNGYVFDETDYGAGNDDAFYRGLEDCRFVNWNGKVYAYGTRWDRIDGMGRICIYELDREMNPVYEIIAESPFDCVCEKNWGAIEGMPFHFVYTVNPTVIIEVESDGRCRKVCEHEYDILYGKDIRGSSPVVMLPDGSGYISLVHKSVSSVDESNLNKTVYVTGCAFYDNDFKLCRLSRWFVFRTDLCEFTCGLCLHDGYVYIPYSQVDCTSNLLNMPLDSFMDFLSMDIDGGYPMYDSSYVYNLALEHEHEGQLYTATVLFNRAAIMDNDDYDVRKECIIKTFAGIIMELDNIGNGVYIANLIKCLKKAYDEYDNSPEFAAMLSFVYRYAGYLENAGYYSLLCINRLHDMHPEFLKYVNTDYLIC